MNINKLILDIMDTDNLILNIMTTFTVGLGICFFITLIVFFGMMFLTSLKLVIMTIGLIIGIYLIGVVAFWSLKLVIRFYER